MMARCATHPGCCEKHASLQWLPDKPGEAVDAWYDLGKGEWSNNDGTVHVYLYSYLLFPPLSLQ